MSNEVLSQDQIEEMLRGAGQIEETSEEQAPAGAGDGRSRDVNDYFTKDDQDILGEMGNICMGTAATTMFTLLTRQVNITTPKLEIFSIEELSQQFPCPIVVVEVTYTEGVDGNNLLILQREDVALITDLLLGGDGKIDPSTVEMDELHLSAIQEVMNQMVGSSATSLSDLISERVDISTPHAKELVMADTQISEAFKDKDELILKISFCMEIEDLLTSEIMQILPISFGKELATRILKNLTGSHEPLTPIEDQPVPQQTAAPQQPAAPQAGSSAPAPGAYEAPPQTGQQYAAAPPPPQQYGAPPQENPYAAVPPQYAQPPYGYGQPQMGYPPYGQPMYAPAQQYYAPPGIRRDNNAVDVKEAQFPSFDDVMRENAIAPESINMILDVPMQVTVELGKIKKKIKEVLGYNTGSVIVLDKVAGEAVDILVNGKLIGKGEVVVIEDNYGVRITEINIPSADQLL